MFLHVPNKKSDTLLMLMPNAFQQNKSISPVFIMGVPRSGTTLLYKTFLEHSSFRPQLSSKSDVSLLIESNAFMCPSVVFLDERANKYLLLNKAVRQGFLDSVSRIKYFQELGNFLYKHTLLRTSNPRLRSLTFKIGLNHIVLKRFFYYAQIARNTKRILEKTPSHITRLPEIKATYPNAKCIFICRHPVDVLSSYRKRLTLAKKVEGEFKKSWLKISTKSFCNLYREYIRLALEEKRQNAINFMLIKFENVVATPFQSLQEICRFLEEPFEKNIVPRGKSSKKAQFSSFLGGEIVKSTKNWEDFLQYEDAQAIENELSDVIRRFGYPRYTNTSARTSF